MKISFGWMAAGLLLSAAFASSSALAQSSGNAAQPPRTASATSPAATTQCDGCFAHLKSDGTLDTAFGVTSAALAEPPGGYEVIFNHNVTNCVFIATLGFSKFRGVPDPGFVTTVGRFNTRNGVFVQTFDINGARANRAFHLLVECPH